jgi:hypothetical protein
MLRLVDLRVPSHTIRGQAVRLECHYDLEGEALYSVKWYKVSHQYLQQLREKIRYSLMLFSCIMQDLHEFFRFLPGDNPPASIVNASGVSVDVSLP